MQLTRPKYFFPGIAPQQLDVHGKVGPVGQASAALEGLLVNADVYLLEQSARSPRGCGTLCEFIPNPIPMPYQTGMPESGWQWFEFDAGEGRAGFIGWPEGVEIGPENFERTRVIEGAEVTDEHGRNWVLPVGRMATREFGTLPTRNAMTPKGWKTKPLKDFEGLWAFCGETLDYLRAINAWRLDATPLPSAWSDPWAFDAAVKAIGTNYHFGDAEVLLLDELELGIMSVDFVAPVLHSITDYQAYLEYQLQKKTREAAATIAASSNSNTGDQAA